MKKISEHVKFAFTLAVIPFIPAFLLYKNGYKIQAVDVIAVFWVLSLICFISKRFASLLKRTTEKIGGFLGEYIAIIVLIFVYIFAVIPTGIIMKAVKRDRLKLRKKDVLTYWEKFETVNRDYQDQF